MGNCNSNKIYSEEIKKHNNIEDLWIIIDNKVYDVTEFVQHHPGGIKPLCDVAGKDATIHFKNIKAHNKSSIQKYMKNYFIGYLKN